MALEKPLRKSNLGQKKILRTATWFTHYDKNLV